MMCAHRFIYSQSLNREFLLGICNISRRSEQYHRNNNNNKTVFAVSTCGEAAATGFENIWEDGRI